MTDTQAPIQSKKYSKLAIVSFVSSIISLILYFYITLFLLTLTGGSIGGNVWSILILILLLILFFAPFVLGIISLRKIKKDPSLKGKGLAKAGTIIGSIPVILILIFTVAIILTPHHEQSISPRECNIHGGVCLDACTPSDTYLPVNYTCIDNKVCCLNLDYFKD